MTVINHVLTGAAISLIVKNPVTALSLAFVSHFVLDLLPHYGRDTSDFLHKVVRADGVLSVLFVVLALLLLDAPSIALLLGCMFVAYLPDAIWIRYYLYDKRHGTRLERGKIATFLHKIQWGERPWLLPVEVAYGFAAVAFLVVVR